MSGKRNTRWLESSQQSEVTDNDSDKTFTVPTGKSWRILSVHVRLVTTATVGNRQIEVRLTDDSNNNIGHAPAGAVQAASLTRHYTFAPGLADLTGFRDTDKLTTPLPDVVLPAGYKVRIFDTAAVDAAADDMHVRMLVEELVE